MGTLQLQFMPCQPGASHILLRHMFIHSFTFRSYPKVRVWTCPAYHIRNKHICQHFPFWGSFSYERNSQIGVHYFIRLMGSSLLLLHTSPPPQLTHKHCCPSVVKEEETDYLLAWHTRSTDRLVKEKLLPISEDPEVKEVRRRRMDQATWFRINLRATEYPHLPNTKMLSSHNVEETPCFSDRWHLETNLLTKLVNTCCLSM